MGFGKEGSKRGRLLPHAAARPWILAAFSAIWTTWTWRSVSELSSAVSYCCRAVMQREGNELVVFWVLIKGHALIMW